MKYALLIYGEPGAREHAAPGHDGDGIIDSWLDYTAAIRDAGILLAAEQLRPVETATTTTGRTGERLLTDGPFIETKEHLLGFYLVDVPDLDAALRWAAKAPIMRYGSVEIRPVVEGAEWQEPLQ